MFSATVHFTPSDADATVLSGLAGSANRVLELFLLLQLTGAAR